MGLKKKSKVSADFNMSSLTDIIFLLLIFFMLTSSVITPNALNLKMPGKSNSTVTVDSEPDDITIRRDGSFTVNGRRVSKSNVEKTIRDLQRKKRGKLDLTISPSKSAPTESVALVMDVARRLGVNGILAMEVD